MTLRTLSPNTGTTNGSDRVSEFFTWLALSSSIALTAISVLESLVTKYPSRYNHCVLIRLASSILLDVSSRFAPKKHLHQSCLQPLLYYTRATAGFFNLGSLFSQGFDQIILSFFVYQRHQPLVNSMLRKKIVCYFDFIICQNGTYTK